MGWGRVLGSVSMSAAVVASTLVVTGVPAGAAPIETVAVSTKSKIGQSSAAVLQAGTTYVFEASGTGVYDRQGNRMDVECSTLQPDPTWQPFRYFFLAPDSDMLDLLVNGSNVTWAPVVSDVFGCNSSNHRYRLTFTPEFSGPVNFRVLDTGYSDNNGTFLVDIHEATENLVQTLNVPTNARFGVTSVALDASKFYRIKVGGTGGYDKAGSLLDAECTTFVPDPTWQPNRWIILDQEGDIGDLYINGENVAWRPETSDLLGCDSTQHRYDVIFRPAASGPVNFGVYDTNYGDNTGSLVVSIFELAFTPTEGDEILSPPSVTLAEQLEVDSRSRDGTTGTVPFAAGQQVLIEISGTYTYGSFGTADARCSTLNSATYVPSETNYPAPPGVLQVVVNDQIVPWTPTAPDGAHPECNSADHQYRLIYMPPQSGFLNFRVVDSRYTDNGGVLTVRIFRIREIPVGMVFVDSMNPAGSSTPPLMDGRTYRLRAAGTYTYFQGAQGAEADAECSQAEFAGLPLFQRHLFGTGNADLLDVFVNNVGVEWVTSAGSQTACDPDHAFDHTLTASGGAPANLKVRDNKYTDNAGVVQVELFLQVS